MRRRMSKTVLMLGGCLAVGTGALADTPRDLGDLVGARGGQAEGELQSRGYVFVSTQGGSDRKWSNWWNARTQTCVTIVTYNGRYDSITTSPAPDCGRGAGSRPDYSGPYPPPSRPPYGGGYDDAYDRGNSLTLICYGEGRRPSSSYRSGYVWNSRSRRYEYGGFVENSTQGAVSLTATRL